MAEVKPINLSNLIGMTERQAYNKIQNNGHIYRIARRDNKFYGHIQSYDQYRVNLEIDKGKITNAKLG